MSSQKVVQTREEKLEAILPLIKDWILLKCLYSSWMDALNHVQNIGYSTPEKIADSLREASDVIERIQRILSKLQDKLNTKLVQCIDVIALELYDNAVQNAVTGDLIHPVRHLLFHLRMKKNPSDFNADVIKFTDTGLRLLLRFV